MKEIEDLFDALEQDAEAFMNLSMLVMTTLVNKGLLSMHWDLSSKQFCFTVNYDWEEEGLFEPEEEEVEFDPSEILRRMGLRENKKKNNGPQ